MAERRRTKIAGSGDERENLFLSAFPPPLYYSSRLFNQWHTHTRRTMKGRRKTLSFRDVCFCSKVLLRLHCLHFAAPSLPISDRPHPSRRLSSPALPELTNQSGKRLKRPKIGLFTEPRIKFHDGPLTQLPTTLPRLSLLPTFRLESFLHPT